jgi:hypothetical protein
VRIRNNQPLPLARQDELIIQELPDELLVYDLAQHKAHCLNKTSAFVWKHCDGETTVAETVALLERELSQLVDEDVVWLALGQLRKFQLLDEAGGKISTTRVTRRDLMRKYLPAALSLPLIVSIAAPTAAQTASTCAGLGQSCEIIECCPGLTCDGTCFPD